MNGFLEWRIKYLYYQDSLQIPETRTSFHFGEKRSAKCEFIAIPSASLKIDAGGIMIEDRGFMIFDSEARFQSL
jgi:hypothetical protein